MILTMASVTNKVRYGLSNVHYAVWDETNHQYGTPKRLAGAVSISFEPQGSQNNFYADNIVYHVTNASANDTGTLEIADITDEAKKDIFGYVEDTATGLLYEVTNVSLPTFALMYQVEGDGNTERGIRYNVTASRLSETHSTTNDSVEPQTYSVAYTAVGRDFTIDGEVVNIIKATCKNAGDTHLSFDNWFTEVIMPGTVAVDTEVPTLSSIGIDDLALTPDFASDVTLYRVTTSAESSVVTATTADTSAAITISVNGTDVEPGDTVTWQAGLNEVVFTVNNGEFNSYTVLVTKSE